MTPLLFKEAHKQSYLNEGDRQYAVEAHTQTHKHYTPLRCQYRLIDQDGRSCWFLDEANIVINELSAPLFLQGIPFDITKDKETTLELANYGQHPEELVMQRTEQLDKLNAALATSNANLAKSMGELRRVKDELCIAAAVFESQAAIAVTNADKMILRVSSAFTRITGYSIKEAMSLAVFSHKGTNVTFLLGIWATVEREGFWQGEVWENRKGGEALALWITLSKVTDQDGNITNYVATFTDITVLKQAERILLDARGRLEAELATTQAETTEINTALNVLLRHRVTDRAEAQSELTYEFETTVLPLLIKLKGASKNRLQSLRIVNMLENSLQNMMKSYGDDNHVNVAYKKLTPVETQVASMVKLGQPTKVIAATLNISTGTAHIHRKHIRKKLGLDGKTNLQGYLQSLVNAY